MKTAVFGKTKEGNDVTAYTIANKNGMEITLLDFGAILHAIMLPNADGSKTDVALTCPNMEIYNENSKYLGSTIAPNANRIGNAKLTIDGVEYSMEVNDGDNNLHTAFDTGMNKRLWKAEPADNSVKFTAVVEDGEHGLPGNRVLTVTYTLTDDNEIKIEYTGTSDKNTIINMTNHTYFNLKGQGNGDILNHELWLNADSFTMTDDGGIPTGEIRKVEGTPLDFRVMKPIYRDNDINNEIMALVNGYDHNYCINDWDGTMKKVAEVKEPETGRVMEVYSDLPGIQFYAGNYVEEDPGKEGTVYNKNYGLCLETQYYPDHINHPEFAQAVFGPGKDYATTTIYKFC